MSLRVPVRDPIGYCEYEGSYGLGYKASFKRSIRYCEYEGTMVLGLRLPLRDLQGTACMRVLWFWV